MSRSNKPKGYFKEFLVPEGDWYKIHFVNWDVAESTFIQTTKPEFIAEYYEDDERGYAFHELWDGK